MPRLSPFILLGLAATALAQDAGFVPTGWALAGSNPAHYFVAVDHPATGTGGASASLISRSGHRRHQLWGWPTWQRRGMAGSVKAGKR